ncbi:MAG: hypothetical protein IPI93_05355 [Sphingobacteriaceae bacterium]|nr:hypothetical protein [Sphingobacteriaceae bacterium]
MKKITEILNRITTKKTTLILICFFITTFGLKGRSGAFRNFIKEDVDSTRHFISMNLVQLRFPTLAFSYEYIFAKGYLGIRIPFAKGLSQTEPENYNKAVKYSYGVDLNVYFGKGNFSNKKAVFFMAPSFEHGAFNYSNIKETIVGYSSVGLGWQTPIYKVTKSSYVGYQYTTMLKIGLLLKPVKNLNISLVAGIGGIAFNPVYRSHGETPWLDLNLGPASVSNSKHEDAMITKLELNIGYKF